jgi:hypothetical protein
LPAGVSVFLHDKSIKVKHDTTTKISFIIPVLLL